MSIPERLVGARVDFLYDRLLPALRGHVAIHSGDLVALARERGLTVPAGEPAARRQEWIDLLAALAGVEPLPGVSDKPVRLIPVVRDLTDLVEGPAAPQPWWQRVFPGSRPEPKVDSAAAADLLALCGKLADGIALPPELVRPLIGRFSGALEESDVHALRSALDTLGRDRWLALGSQSVNRDDWGDCYDVLQAATAVACERSLGLLYDAGY